MIYARKNSWVLTTRISEHKKEDSLLGEFPVECCGSTSNIEVKFPVSFCTGEEVKPLKAKCICKMKPVLRKSGELSEPNNIEILFLVTTLKINYRATRSKIWSQFFQETYCLELEIFCISFTKD